MHMKKSAPLFLEPLEDRWVPATVRFVSGTLLISNQTGALTVTQSGATANKFTVTDGASNNGTYSGVGNINITGTNAANTIKVDLGTKIYTGSLSVNAGNGNDSISLGNGGVGGNISLVPGLGADTVSLAAGYTTGGNFQYTNTTGLDTFETKGVRIGGSLTVTSANVSLGADTIGNAVNINNAILNVNTNVAIGAATIGTNLNVTSGAGNDTVTLTGTNVGGTAQLNAGEGNNSLTTAGATLIGGDLRLTAGTGDDTVGLSAGTTVNGGLNISVSEGVNNLTGLNTAFTVFGNTNITLGNGDNTAFSVAGNTNGAVFFNIGNGNNSISLTGTSGGDVNWRSGNGNNLFTLGSGANNYSINVVFGNGDDSLTFATTGIIDGFADGGGQLIADVFTQGGATLAPTFVLSNFP